MNSDSMLIKPGIYFMPVSPVLSDQCREFDPLTIRHATKEIKYLIFKLKTSVFLGGCRKISQIGWKFIPV